MIDLNKPTDNPQCAICGTVHSNPVSATEANEIPPVVRQLLDAMFGDRESVTLPGDSVAPYFTVQELGVLNVLVNQGLRNGLLNTMGRRTNTSEDRALGILRSLAVKVSTADSDARNGRGELFKSPF